MKRGISEHGFSRLASFVAAKEPEETQGSEDSVFDESDDPGIREDVIKFLEENPDPEDEEFHAWAEERGYDIHEVEDIMYELATDFVEGEEFEGSEDSDDDFEDDEEDEEDEDRIPGGKADGAEDEDFPMEQLLKGIKVEREHTDDDEVAKEISKDHLEESPKYYDALDKMEQGLKKD